MTAAATAAKAIRRNAFTAFPSFIAACGGSAGDRDAIEPPAMARDALAVAVSNVAPLKSGVA